MAATVEASGQRCVPVFTGAALLVLLTLAAAQFLMTLGTTVMNVSIAAVASDIGATVPGAQSAVCLYTLVIATMLITGARLGGRLGRRRTFCIGCVIFGAGALTAALAPTLPVLILGWSLLEGLGAALIVPAIVALVSANISVAARPRAIGVLAAAVVLAATLGPLIGGFVSTVFSWRLIFAGEIVVVLVVFLLARGIPDSPRERRQRFDPVGVVLSAAGLGAIVFGLLRSSQWGWVRANLDAPALLGLSPTVWLVLGGAVVLWLFFVWEKRVERRHGEPLWRREMLRSRRLRGGLVACFAEFFVLAGMLLAVPLYLTIVLGLSPLSTGLRLLPLSLASLLTAILVPRLLPHASPRRLARCAFIAITAGVVLMIFSLGPGSGQGILVVPLLLLGSGIGALSTQIGNVNASAAPRGQSAEVGGLQSTTILLSATLGAAIAGSIVITALSGVLLQDVQHDAAIPQTVKQPLSVRIHEGLPLFSDAQAKTRLLAAGVAPDVTKEIVMVHSRARLDGLRSALAVLALIGVVALYFTKLLPTVQPTGPPGEAEAGRGQPARSASPLQDDPGGSLP